MKILMAGSKIHDKHGVLKVISTHDGFVVLRRPSCPAFVVPIKELSSGYYKADDGTALEVA